jgi:TolB-like protein/cytochrome c-type biogenesis protein CcmH/NrfG
MTSIIEGYNYDIFISYRQKDNKYDGWVTEFVDNLKKELEATFKEEISIYFDVNPHDGLLETHDVDESLKEKLKCLIFIPIISRTYCDPKAFAWEHEFKAFVDNVSKDEFGLKVKLPGSNVGSRVLPVLIHELDRADIKECESVLGGVLRGIEFIYKEPGVNKPLTIDDNEKKNLNGTKYRIQINKTANAINEIISGLKKEPVEQTPERKEDILIEDKPPVKEKSIIVLPFQNISPDPDQDYFSDGLTEEIITDLSYIDDLLVISRSSAMTFKGTNKTLKEVTAELNVKYALEGSVRKSGNNIRIVAQLIDGANDSHIWADKYTGTLEDVFDIQEKVSRSIAEALKIKLSSKEKKKIDQRPIDNAFAYDCLKRAYPEITSMSKDRIDYGLNLLQKGLEVTGDNAVIYGGMGSAYMQYANIGFETVENIAKTEEFLQKALNMNPELPEALFIMGGLKILKDGDAYAGIDHWKRAHRSSPDDPEIMIYLALMYAIIGQKEAAKELVDTIVRIDPINPMCDAVTGWVHFFSGRYEMAQVSLFAAYKLTPESPMHQFFKALILFYNDRADEAYDFINEVVDESNSNAWTWMTLFIKYAIKRDGEKVVSLMLTPELVPQMQMDLQNSFHIATFYSYMEEKEEALKWLENSVNRGFINYPLLNEQDKLLDNVREEKHFKLLMERVRHEWENYKI